MKVVSPSPKCKRRLGRCRPCGSSAAVLTPKNAPLLINIGTVGEALFARQGLAAITNNIDVANRLGLDPSLEVVTAVGLVRAAASGIVGDAAVDIIRQFKLGFLDLRRFGDR